MSDSLWPRLLCPWDSPGKNTGVGCHFLLHVNPNSLFKVHSWGHLLWDALSPLWGCGPLPSAFCALHLTFMLLTLSITWVWYLFLSRVWALEYCFIHFYILRAVSGSQKKYSKYFLKTMEEYKEHLSISLDYGFCYYDTSLENRRIVKLMPSKLIVSTTFLNLILRMTAVVSLSGLTYSTSSSTSNREDRICSFQMEYGIITYW